MQRSLDPQITIDDRGQPAAATACDCGHWCRWRPSLCGWRDSALLFHVAEDRCRILAGEAQIRHPDLLVLLPQRQSDRIALRHHLVGLDDEAREPGAIAAPGDAPKVRADPVA